MYGICLVGCGRIAATHARHLAGRAKLLYHSRTRASAERLARLCGGEVIPAWDDALRRPDVRALVICSPPEYHCEQVVGGLEAGKSVLVEKPMCVGRDEIDRISAAAVAAPPGAHLMVAENYYYKPAVKLLRWMVRADFVGEARQIRVRKVFLQRATGWKQQHGALLEGGIHFVALVSALAERCGQEAPVRVSAQFPGHRAGEPERSSCTCLEYENGLTAELEYAWNRPALLRGILQHSHVRGTRGRVIFESNGLYAILLAAGRRRLYWPGWRDLMGQQTMMEDFLACLDQPDHEPVSSLRRARRDLEIVLAAYAAAVPRQ